MYSPITPMKMNWRPIKKNSPIINGAMPTGKEAQKIIFKIKYITPIRKLTAPIKNPKNAQNLIGNFE